MIVSIALVACFVVRMVRLVRNKVASGDEFLVLLLNLMTGILALVFEIPAATVAASITPFTIFASAILAALFDMAFATFQGFLKGLKDLTKRQEHSWIPQKRAAVDNSKEN